MVNITIKGKITIYNRTKGRIEFVKENLVTDIGKNFVADRFINDNVNYVTHLAIGNGSGTHNSSSTSLFNEIFRKEIEHKSSEDNKVILITTILGDEAIGNWTELGIFNSDTDGVMTNVASVSYNHIENDEVEVKWEITFN